MQISPAHHASLSPMGRSCPMVLSVHVHFLCSVGGNLNLPLILTFDIPAANLPNFIICLTSLYAKDGLDKHPFPKCTLWWSLRRFPLPQFFDCLPFFRLHSVVNYYVTASNQINSWHSFCSIWQILAKGRLFQSKVC